MPYHTIAPGTLLDDDTDDDAYLRWYRELRRKVSNSVWYRLSLSSISSCSAVLGQAQQAPVPDDVTFPLSLGWLDDAGVFVTRGRNSVQQVTVLLTTATEGTKSQIYPKVNT